MNDKCKYNESSARCKNVISTHTIWASLCDEHWGTPCIICMKTEWDVHVRCCYNFHICLDCNKINGSQKNCKDCENT